MKWFGRTSVITKAGGWFLWGLLDLGVDALDLDPSKLVCQVETVGGETLQDHLGLSCNISLPHEPYCQCTTIMNDTYYSQMHWIPRTNETDKKLNETQPGYWYFTDATRNCVLAAENNDSMADALPCPPGFYCEGGFSQPRSCYKGEHCPFKTPGGDRKCPEGYFCHTPVMPKILCPNGATCPEGSSEPQGCEPGYYCRNGHTNVCPADNYCPFGSEEPRECPFLTLCPEASGFPGLAIPCSMLLVACAVVCMLFVKFYESIIEKWRRWMVCLVFLVIVVFSWFMSTPLAIFVLVNYVLVVGNWIPLQVSDCPQWAARVFLVMTLVTVLVVLWFWHPQMTAFLAGMVLLAFIGFLMSRQSLIVVNIGRSILGLTFVSLLVVMWHIDVEFSVGFLTFLFFAVVALLGSWVFKSRRRGRGAILPPFVMLRWRDTTLDALGPTSWQRGDSDLECGNRSRRAGDPGDEDETALTTPLPGVHASSLRSDSMPSDNFETAGKVQGVSFNLSDVDFELFDGAKLLSKMTLNIDQGRRVAVMGPSGSGKSTLLAVLSGRASYGRVQGDILVSGRSTTDLSFLRHVTGYVPQDDVLHGELSVKDNVSFQAALRLPSQLTEVDIKNCVNEVLSILSLSQLAAARVGTVEQRGISGGQRKRVSIAMELVGKPLLLFADEPTSGLDSTTSHEVVRALNDGAANIGTTVIAVIHQPRYQTLCLFDDLVLLGAGGYLVYAGSTSEIVNYFQGHLSVQFEPNQNPADIILDEIQLREEEPSNCDPHEKFTRPQYCAEIWRQCVSTKTKPLPAAKLSRKAFHRPRLPLVSSMLVFMDRSIRQLLKSYPTLLVNYALCMAATVILCVLVDNQRFDNFIAQASFVALAMMLLQGVAAQRTFGNDLLITWREAQVGVPIIPYFLGKDLASLLEITTTSIVFTATYGAFSHIQMSLIDLFVGTWSFIYAVTGLNFTFSIVMGVTAAQMCAVIAAFVSFCVAGVFNPTLPNLTVMLGGRGWMVPTLSPVRWFVGFLITREAHFLTAITRDGASGHLGWMGYDLGQLSDSCGGDKELSPTQAQHFEQPLRLPVLWIKGRCWVCTVSEMLLLGILFRFIAGMSLILYVSGHKSGWTSFFDHSGSFWKLMGKTYMLLMAAFMGLFLFGEIWVLGWTNIQTVL